MGAKKHHLFSHQVQHNSQLAYVLSSEARIQILKFLNEHGLINAPILKKIVPRHIKTINHHIKEIEMVGLISGQYEQTNYFWIKNAQAKKDWEKIRAFLE